MIVDSSALLAILLHEPEAARFAVALLDSPSRKMAAPTYLELSMISLSRRGPDGPRDIDLALGRFGIQIIPFTEPQVVIGREAFRRYGKGRHRAGLNFGDCVSYALAKETGEELLFKGTDFAQTDVAVAQY